MTSTIASSQKTPLFPIVLALLEIATYLSLDAYLPALPSMMHDLSQPKSSIQMTLTAWFLGSASLQLLIGPLSDRYGRKYIVIFGGGVFVLASLICALTHMFSLLLLGRFFQGMAVCTTIVAGQASIHELYSTQRAIQISAIMGSITILAPAVGPLLGALIIEHYHWRYIFGMLFLWGAITSAALCFQMKETLKHSTPIQIKSILHDYPSIMRDQTYMRYCMTACALFFGLEAWLLSSPFLVIHTYHLTSVYLGIAQLIIFSSYILGMQYCRYAITRYPSTTLMNHTILITFFSAASLCGLTYWMTTPPIWSIIALIALTGFGSAATSTPLTRLAMEAHPASMGKKMALYSFCFSLTGVLGAILLTMIPIHTPFPMACLMTLGALLALLLLQSPWPQPQTPTFLKTL